jgi:hypothetical protein
MKGMGGESDRSIFKMKRLTPVILATEEAEIRRKILV